MKRDRWKDAGKLEGVSRKLQGAFAMLKWIESRV